MSDKWWVSDSVAEQAPQEGRFMGAMRTIGNDIDAGMQGVNPVATGKMAAQTSPLGKVVPNGTGKPRAMFYDDGQGTFMELDQLPGDKFITHMHEDGNTYIYRRTEDLNENRAASAGRVFGYANPAGRAPVLMGDAVSSIDKAGDAVNVSPSLGMRGNIGAKTAAAGEAFLPTSGRVLRDSNRAAQEMADAATGIARSVSGTRTQRDAGEALIGGANYFRQRSGDIGEKLYNRVANFLPKGTVAATGETERVLSRIVNKFEGKVAIGKLVGTEKFQDILGDVSGGMTWDQMSDLRSHLMQVQRGDGSLLGTLQSGDRKAIIQALTSDMEATAKAAGGNAETAWNNARNFWKQRADVIDGALAKVFKADSGEKAFADVFAMTSGSTSRANVRDLVTIKSKMQPDAWAEVVSTVVDRMGRATPGAQTAAGDAFSASTFLTNWNKISDEAKLVLFQGKGVPDGLRTQLNSLAELADAAKQGGVELNKSRSAAVGATLAQGAAGTAALGAAARGDIGTTATFTIGTLMAYLGARALTNPKIVRGLSSFAKTGDVNLLVRYSGGKSPGAIELANALRLAGSQSQAVQAP